MGFPCHVFPNATQNNAAFSLVNRSFSRRNLSPSSMRNDVPRMNRQTRKYIEHARDCTFKAGDSVISRRIFLSRTLYSVIDTLLPPHSVSATNVFLIIRPRIIPDNEKTLSWLQKRHREESRAFACFDSRPCVHIRNL